MAEDPKAVYYVIIGRRHAHVLKQVEALLKDHPEFRVLADRRQRERRQGSGSVRSERRKGKNRRV